MLLYRIRIEEREALKNIVSFKYNILGVPKKNHPSLLPKKTIAKSKYSSQGLFKRDSFKGKNLPVIIEQTLADTVNYAISANTRSTYNTAVNILNLCRSELEEEMAFPLDERDILIFIGFCIKRGNTGNTVKSYLSGLKKFHIALGFQKFEYLTPLVKEVLEGQNKKITRFRGKGGQVEGKKGQGVRLPCTMNILKLIKLELRLANLDPDEKIVVWATCTLAFFGALRMSELLCKDKNEYDPLDTLQKRDVKICPPDSTGKESVNIKIRNSKTSKGKREIVSVYANYGPTCPVAATRKLLLITKNCPNDAPAMCDRQGRVLTLDRLNHILFLLTKDDFGQERITGHSFRAGLISMFAKLGHSDLDLKSIGRWSSRAYLEYVKLNRSRRHEMTLAASTLK